MSVLSTSGQPSTNPFVSIERLGSRIMLKLWRRNNDCVIVETDPEELWFIGQAIMNASEIRKETP